MIENTNHKNEKVKETLLEVTYKLDKISDSLGEDNLKNIVKLLSSIYDEIE